MEPAGGSALVDPAVLEDALVVARAWLAEKGWPEDRYALSASTVQSCPSGRSRTLAATLLIDWPAGFVSIDVTHDGVDSDDEAEDAVTPLSDTERQRRSRVLVSVQLRPICRGLPIR